MIREAISKIIGGSDLGTDEMAEVMGEVMGGVATPAQIGSLITALSMKGETADEITGAARVMREKATRIEADTERLIDTCGTGGDGSMTFNISTASALVAAGAGLSVAKHGNRSVSSRCGSADVLSELGVNIEAGVECVEECIREAGIGFLFAPMLHNAMKHAAPVRRELGIRSIFNVLGPLTNPAGALRQVIGVYDAALTGVMAEVLRNLGSIHAFVVHGEDGLDEITLTGRTRVTELKDGEIRTYYVEPEEFGLSRCKPEDLKGGDPKLNASIVIGVLSGERGPARDVVLLNAAAAITAGGVSGSLAEGMEAAARSIDSGSALERLDKLRQSSNA